MIQITPAKLAFLSQPEPDKLVLIIQTEGKTGISRGLAETQQFEITRGMLRNMVVDGIAVLMEGVS